MPKIYLCPPEVIAISFDFAPGLLGIIWNRTIKSAPLSYSLYIDFMPRVAKTKNGFSPKICASCGLEFEWRKKWQRDWENVKYCSEKCKSK